MSKEDTFVTLKIPTNIYEKYRIYCVRKDIKVNKEIVDHMVNVVKHYEFNNGKIN